MLYPKGSPYLYIQYSLYLNKNIFVMCFHHYCYCRTIARVGLYMYMIICNLS